MKRRHITGRSSHFTFHGVLEVRHGINSLKNLSRQTTLGTNILAATPVNHHARSNHQGVETEEVDHDYGAVLTELPFRAVLLVADLIQTVNGTTARQRKAGLSIRGTQTFRLGRRVRHECLLTFLQIFWSDFAEATSDPSVRLVFGLSFQKDGSVIGNALGRVRDFFHGSFSGDFIKHVLHGTIDTVNHDLRLWVFQNQQQGS